MAKTRRDPGALPHLTQHAMRPYKRLAEGDGKITRSDLLVLVKAMVDAFRAQDKFNEAQRAQAEDSLPGLHGATHRGGLDNLAGTDTPSALSSTATGDAGTPQDGFAPIDHEHPAGDLGDLAEIVAADKLDGAVSVEDAQARRLLEEIFVELEELAGLLPIESPDLGVEDLRFPATLVNPPGLASDPTVDTNDGTLLFAAGATNVIFILAQMPHALRPGAQVEPHVHWSPTSADTGNVLWRLSYQWAAKGGVFSGAWTDLDLVAAGLGTAERHQTSYFPLVDVPTWPSSMFKIKLSRIGGDALDTYADNARLLEFDIHFPRWR